MNSLINSARNKFREIVLILASLLVFLQLLVGTFLDLWFGFLIVGLIWVSFKIQGPNSPTGAPGNDND